MVDINRNTSIYHLHIPRTAGVFLRKHFIPEFSEHETFSTHYDQLVLDSISDKKYISGHFGTTPIEHMTSPTVFTVLRDPIDRFISYARYTRSFFQKDSMHELLYGEYSVLHQNTQTKFITNGIDIDLYNKNLVSSETIQRNWFIGQEESFEKAKNFIDNNIVVTLETIEKLPRLLGIKNFKDLDKQNSTRSKADITKEQYDRIVSMNQLDMEIYQYAKTQKNY
jgi:hypothetical protein